MFSWCQVNIQGYDFLGLALSARSALCSMWPCIFADNLRRDVHAGYGFGTNYDIPVVILWEQDFGVYRTLGFPIWKKFWLNWKYIYGKSVFNYRLFWNKDTFEPLQWMSWLNVVCRNTFLVKFTVLYGYTKQNLFA